MFLGCLSVCCVLVRAEELPTGLLLSKSLFVRKPAVGFWGPNMKLAVAVIGDSTEQGCVELKSWGHDRRSQMI